MDFLTFQKFAQKYADFVKEFIKENLMVWGKLWIELSLRLLVLWYLETVRLKGLDAYYPNFDISYDWEYSTCDYCIICVRNALFNVFGIKIAVFGYILYSMSHMIGLKYFEYYKEYLYILLTLLEHI